MKKIDTLTIIGHPTGLNDLEKLVIDDNRIVKLDVIFGEELPDTTPEDMISRKILGGIIEIQDGIIREDKTAIKGTKVRFKSLKLW